MKKLSALLITAAALLALAGCGGGEAAQAGGETATPSQPEAAQAEVFENKIDVSLDKEKYEKEERIEVTLDFNSLNKEAAVIAIVSSDTEHGSEKQAHDNYEEYRWLADFSEIPFYLWAPDKAGAFDVRVYADGDGGEELASVSIAVA